MELTEHQKQLVRNAEQVSLTLQTPGWVTVIKPLLDKLINDCIGYRDKNGQWVAGELQKGVNSTPNQIQDYSKALIEFETMIYDHIRMAEGIKRVHEEKTAKKTTFTTPLKDTRYAND